MTDLEYPDVLHEFKGAMAPGRLKFSDQNIIFKNNKTGKVDHISSNDIDIINWQKFVTACGLRIFLKNGTLHRYHGFKEGDQEKISKFVSSNYSKDLVDKDMSVKGWNWGTAKFSGSVLSFDIGSNTAFEVPLNYVAQCTTGKNEVTVEFHQNDDASVSLMEMRFHIPTSELAGEDPVDNFHQNVMNKASVINVSGDALAIFREIHCLNPRGRYDLKVFSSFFQLHGKTFDYKIPAHSVLRLFLLPHHDKRQIFFVVSLDPPIKQGQTRYHFLVCLFPVEDDEISIELPYTEEELKEKYEGKLEKELKGQTYEVLGKLTKAIVGRKLTIPNYVGQSDTPAIACSYKAAAGYVYPLERGFMYLRKPPFYIRFEEIVSVNFARSGGSTRSFDFEVEVKSGIVHTFSSIEKDEYGKLYDFISAKKLTVKNRGKSDKPNYNDGDLVDSDQEEPDAYLARVKREGEERDDDGGDDDESSTDEDFKPEEEESDVAEEYDTDAASTDSDGEGGGGGGSDGSGKPEKKEKKHKKTITISEKPRKRKEKKEKKKKDSNAPKRPQSAYFIWMNENRDKIREKHPGLSVAEVAKKAGELWRELKDKTEWEEKAKKAKSDYEEAMREYKASGGGADVDGGKPKKKGAASASKSKPSPSKAMGGTGFKSKEYLSDTGSSSGEDKPSKKKDAELDEDGMKKANASGKSKKASSESDSGSEKEAKKKTSSLAKGKKASSNESESESDEDNKSKTKIGKKKEDSGPKKETKKKASSDESESESDQDTKSKNKKGKKKEVKKKATAKSKKASSEESGSESDDDKGSKMKRKREDSDKETTKKSRRDGPSDIKLDDDIENDDNLPDEPDESTPPTTEESGAESGSDSD